MVVERHGDPTRSSAKLGTPHPGRLGESYVDGDWDCDDLVALFSMLGRSIRDAAADRPRDPAPARLPGAAARTGRNAQTLDVAKDNIHSHYDLGNDLFRLMLDPTMTYSCAYWERPGMTLEEAQRAKYRQICEKLRARPGRPRARDRVRLGRVRDPRGVGATAAGSPG